MGGEGKREREKRRREDINRERKGTFAIQTYIMATNFALFFSHEEYLPAAPDTQLSSSDSYLLATLLEEEDQHDHNELLNTQLPHDIFDILHQVTSIHTNFHFISLLLLVGVISTSVIIHYMDSCCFTQETRPSRSSHRSSHHRRLHHTLS